MIEWYRTEFGEDELAWIKKAVQGEHISQGTVTVEFEKKIAQALGVPYVVATTSGSVALLMAMMAAKIGPGDEVIVPNRTWIATANAPKLLGAKVVLADVVCELPVIDVKDVRRKLTPRTKAVIPVHLDGRSCDMKSLNVLAKEHGFLVIEDACQAFLSRNRDGCLGTQSDMGCFSLGISKLISTGQGGFIVTRNKDLYEKLKLMRTNGSASVIDAEYQVLGLNFKFTDIQAAMGLAQLNKADQRIAYVRQIYQRYAEALTSFKSLQLIPVRVEEGEVPLYVEVLCEDQSALRDFLKTHGIDARPFLPNLKSASYLGAEGEFHHSQRFAKQGMFLPCGPSQPMKNVEYVIEMLSQFENK